ncbi:hypothetical protein Bca101_025052 [Brassica carinata]
MEQIGGASHHPPFPSRMFDSGEEPIGVRVTPYHKPSCIRKILNALEPDEVQAIRESTFDKLRGKGRSHLPLQYKSAIVAFLLMPNLYQLSVQNPATHTEPD